MLPRFMNEKSDVDAGGLKAIGVPHGNIIFLEAPATTQ